MLDVQSCGMVVVESYGGSFSKGEKNGKHI